MTKNDSICYLNLPPNTLLIGNLGGAIESLPAKMQKAPPAQWINTIKSLVSKGVKQAEIDDCDVLTWLGANPAKSLERAQIQSYIASHQVTIKEVVLGQPRFQSHSHASMDQSATYREILFIANSERANIGPDRGAGVGAGAIRLRARAHGHRGGAGDGARVRARLLDAGKAQGV